MKTYTVTQTGGYQVLRTIDKAEAEAKLAELLKHGNCWYICEQGYDDKIDSYVDGMFTSEGR